MADASSLMDSAENLRKAQSIRRLVATVTGRQPRKFHIKVSHAPATETQQERAIPLLRRQGVARASELLVAGVTAATVSRMLAADKIIQLSRGLYQLPDAPSNLNNALAQVANQEHRRVAKGASADTLTRTQSDVPTDVDQLRA